MAPSVGMRIDDQPRQLSSYEDLEFGSRVTGFDVINSNFQNGCR